MLRFVFFADARRCGSFLLLGLLLVASCRLHTGTPPYPSRLVDSVAVIDAPLIDAQVSPNGKFVYVTNDYAGALSVVRTSDMQLVAQIPFNEGWSSEGQVLCSPDGQYVYATCFRDDWVAVVRTADQVVIDSLMVEGEVTSVAVAPDGKRLYMAVDADSGFIVVVHLPDDVVEDTFFLPAGGDYITSMRVSPDGAHLFAAGQEGYAYAINLTDKTIDWQSKVWVSFAPSGIVLHPTGDPLYVVADDQYVLVLETDAGSIVDSISLPPDVWGVDIAADGSFLYVTCGYDETLGGLGVVRTSDDSVVSVMPMPGAVYDASPSPDGQRLYVAGENGKLYVLSR